MRLDNEHGVRSEPSGEVRGVALRDVLILRGPNVWANSPVLEAWVDLQGLGEIPAGSIPGFTDRLYAWLPELNQHECNTGAPGGLTDQIQTGTSLAHVLEHVTLELQSRAWHPVNYGRTAETPERGVYRIAVKFHEEHLARACLETAVRVVNAAVLDQPLAIVDEIEALRSLAHDVCFGPSTYSIVSAAVARGIPIRRLNSESLVQLGHGKWQRRIRAAETDRTGAIPEAIAQDKDLTRQLLQSIGVPVPQGRPVEDAEDAWAAAQELGGPVVVKPQFGNQGRGVATNLITREQVVAAFAAAKEEGDSIVVERSHTGADYRILVVGDQVIAASRREPAHVIGDGESTIRQLVDEVNRDPRRSDDHATALTKIVLNSIALAVLEEQGYTPDSVPPAGRKVLIRRNANLSTGGTAVDVTDSVHPHVAARAVDAARVIGLDIAGIDVIAEDISRPMEEQGAIVVEVNAGPGLRMHLEPSSGLPRPVGQAIIEMMFPDEQSGRIPLAGIAGTNGKTTVARLLAQIARQRGETVGTSCSDGTFLNTRLLDHRHGASAEGARAILVHPAVERAVIETSTLDTLQQGLGFDRCDLAIVTNIDDGDHLDARGIDSADTLAQVERTVIDVVIPGGTAVLNAADPRVAAMATHCKGSVLFWALSADQPVLREHREGGGRVAFVRSGDLILAEGDREMIVAPLNLIPLTADNRVGFHVENALAACAGAWAWGISIEQIRAGLFSFGKEAADLPGRFNVFTSEGVTIILDQPRNPSGERALASALARFAPEGARRVATSDAEELTRALNDLRRGDVLLITPGNASAALECVQSFLARLPVLPMLDSEFVAADVELAASAAH